MDLSMISSNRRNCTPMSKDFRISFISTKRPAADQEHEHADAYRVWKREWSAELNKSGEAISGSDPFIRNDEVVTLSLREGVVCLGLIKWVDLRRECDRDLSTYAPFGPAAFDPLLARDHHLGLSFNYFTIVTTWRKTTSRVPVADTFLALLLRRMTKTRATVFLGAARRDRGMTALCARYGGQVLASGTMHGNAVDLVAVNVHDALKVEPAAPELVEKLWGPLILPRRRAPSAARGQETLL
jgi:hypothetical protein